MTSERDLDDIIVSGAPDDSRAFRIELNFSLVTPPKYWLMITPSYTWGIDNTDDGGFLKVFTGLNLSEKHSLGMDVKWNYEVRDGLLQEVIRGEKYQVRLQWEIYF